MDLSQEEPDDGLRTGPAPAREEELDLMELFEPSGPVEHEPTSRPHGEAATALFDVEDEEEEEPEEVPADEEEHEEVPADEEEPPPDHGHPEGDWELEYSDLKEPVESERLMFCVPLLDNKSPSVLQGLQQVVLYLRSLNLPVLRLHTDRSREFMNKVVTRWFLSQAIRLTTTEGDAPQQNGTAERAIRWLKSRCRTNLRAAGFPPEHWPVAMRAAAAQQRSEVLGMATKLAAPFGAKCLVRANAYTSVAAAKGEIAESWISGRYAGLSPTVDEGHLVYRDDGKGNGYTQSLHVRTKTLEPPECREQFEGEVVPVRRRIVGKSPPEAEMRPARLSSWTWSTLEAGAKSLLQTWDPEEAKNLVLQVCQTYPDEQYQAGMFSRGGVVGTMRSTWTKSWLASVCARLLKHYAPDATFTSVCLSNSCQKEIHIDSSNLPGTSNLILPVCLPRRGGDLWVELGSGDVVKGPIVSYTDARGKVRHGVVHTLDEDTVFEFDPKRYHVVTPFQGTRVVIVGYTANVLGKAARDDLDGLTDLGFALPDSAYLQAHHQAQEEEIGLHPVSNSATNKGGGWAETFPVTDGFLDFRVDWSLTHRPAASSAHTSPSHEEAVPGLDGSLPLQPVASSVAANPSHREAEPLHWEMYVPQEPFKSPRSK